MSLVQERYEKHYELTMTTQDKHFATKDPVATMHLKKIAARTGGILQHRSPLHHRPLWPADPVSSERQLCTRTQTCGEILTVFKTWKLLWAAESLRFPGSRLSSRSLGWWFSWLRTWQLGDLVGVWGFGNSGKGCVHLEVSWSEWLLGPGTSGKSTSAS